MKTYLIQKATKIFSNGIYLSSGTSMFCVRSNTVNMFASNCIPIIQYAKYGIKWIPVLNSLMTPFIPLVLWWNFCAVISWLSVIAVYICNWISQPGLSYIELFYQLYPQWIAMNNMDKAKHNDWISQSFVTAKYKIALYSRQHICQITCWGEDVVLWITCFARLISKHESYGLK